MMVKAISAIFLFWSCSHPIDDWYPANISVYRSDWQLSHNHESRSILGLFWACEMSTPQGTAVTTGPCAPASWPLVPTTEIGVRVRWRRDRGGGCSSSFAGWLPRTKWTCVNLTPFQRWVIHAAKSFNSVMAITMQNPSSILQCGANDAKKDQDKLRKWCCTKSPEFQCCCSCAWHCQWHKCWLFCNCFWEKCI